VGAVHQAVKPARSIEQGILGVEVEMDKIRVRHGDKLALEGDGLQGWVAHNRLSRSDPNISFAFRGSGNSIRE